MFIIDTASTHRVPRSTHVKQYLFPRDITSGSPIYRRRLDRYNFFKFIDVALIAIVHSEFS